MRLLRAIAWAVLFTVACMAVYVGFFIGGMSDWLAEGLQ